MTLLLTGGHLTPAVALIEHIRQHDTGTTILFAGRLYSRAQTKQLSREKQEVEARGATFIPFDAPKWGHGSVLQRTLQTLRFLPSMLHALVIVGSNRPDVVVSFGSYVAVPIAIAAWIWRVPVLTHEQTRAAGFANSLIARFAETVAIAHEDSRPFFPASKIVLTGNLLRPGIFQKNPPQPKWIQADVKKPLVYITGGSQGSEVINATVSRAIQQLVRDWTVVHQCGNPTASRNYKQELSEIKQRLSPQLRKRYLIREWVTESELAWLYTHCAAVVSRAGANTTEEIAHHRVPAILIPLPFSHRDEQNLNARALSKAGGVLLVPQQKLTPASLVKTLDEVHKNRAQMRASLSALQLTPDAEAHLLHEIKALATK